MLPAAKQTLPPPRKLTRDKVRESSGRPVIVFIRQGTWGRLGEEYHFQGGNWLIRTAARKVVKGV